MVSMWHKGAAHRNIKCKGFCITVQKNLASKHNIIYAMGYIPNCYEFFSSPFLGFVGKSVILFYSEFFGKPILVDFCVLVI